MKMEKTPNEPYFVPTAIVKEELDADPIEVKEESGGTNSDDGTGEDTWDCPRDPALAPANGQTQIPGHNQNTNGIRPILGSVRQEGEWLHPHPLPRGQVAIAGYGAQGQVSSQTLESDFRSIHERFDRVEAELKRISGFMEKILKYVENRHCVPPKPKIFPISTLAQMDELENANDEDYSNVVNYFRYIGGFSLKEVVNVCFKESIHDSLTSLFTWRGREEGQRPLCNCRLLTAIYEAACTNRHFQKPSRSQFQAVMREALRTAKERLRSKIRSRNREAGAKINRNFWSDEPAEDADD